jgi:hypothetical protein
MAGYFTPGFTALTQIQLTGAERIPCDTGSTGGQTPQSAAIPLSVLGAYLPVLATANLTITARAGGGQANATQLGYGINVVTVVATATDSVKLPPAYPGAVVFVRNADAADSTTVFGFGTDTIDAVASATGNAQAAGKGKLYFGTTGAGDGVAGTWVTLLGA